MGDTEKKAVDAQITNLEEQIDSINLLMEDHLNECRCTESEKQTICGTLKKKKVDLGNAISALRDSLYKL